jgi:hypothetical protein
LLAGAAGHRAGRPQPGAVEIPIDQQYHRAEVVVPDLRKDTASVPDADALAAVAAALSAAAEAIASGHPALLDVDLLALSPLRMPA